MIMADVEKRHLFGGKHIDEDDDVSIGLDDDLDMNSHKGCMSDQEMSDMLEKTRFTTETAQETSKVDVIEYECDICHKVSYHKVIERDWCCPYCGYHHDPTVYEEVSAIQKNSLSVDVLARLEEISRRPEPHRQGIVIEPLKVDVWVDGRKEQISLEPGSAEYLEYVEDLAAQDPFRPDDKRHVQLEQHNENLVTKKYDSPDENPEADEGVSAAEVHKRQKIYEQQLKRAEHTKAVRAAIAAAAATPGLSDDKLARMITTDNPALYDPSVNPDDYDEAVVDYVMESTN